MSQLKKAAIGIIGAMQIEVEALCSAMENTETETVGNMTFVYGDLQGKKVVCAKCGIGKVFAAMCAQTMILAYHPAAIVNSGVAGTLSEHLSIGQVAIAEQVVQHDMDTSPIGDPVGLISGINEIFLPTDPRVTDRLTACVEALGVPPAVSQMEDEPGLDLFHRLNHVVYISVGIGENQDLHKKLLYKK